MYANTKKISQLAYQIITDPGFVALPQPLEQRKKKPSTQSRLADSAVQLPVWLQFATTPECCRGGINWRAPNNLSMFVLRSAGAICFWWCTFRRRIFHPAHKIMREGRARAISGVSSNYIADRGSVCVCVFRPQARASERKTKDATAGHLQLAISKLVAQLCENVKSPSSSKLLAHYEQKLLLNMHIKFIIFNLEENII